MQTEYLIRLRNANIVIFSTFAFALFSYFFTTNNLWQVFLYYFNAPFILALSEYSAASVGYQIFAIVISSLILTVAFARKPNARPVHWFSYLPVVLVLGLPVEILCLLAGVVIFRWSGHLGAWLQYSTLLVIFLSNVGTVYILYKHQFSAWMLRVSLWVLVVVVLGTVFDLMATLLQGVFTFSLSEQDLAGFPGWTGRALFPVGNQHTWLLLGMLSAGLFSSIGIWAYVRGVLVSFKKFD